MWIRNAVFPGLNVHIVQNSMGHRGLLNTQPCRGEPSQSSPVGLARFPLLSLRDIFPRSGGSLSSQGELTPSVIAYGDATFPKGTASAMAGKLPAKPQSARFRQFRPLRRSRARFPFLSPTVTSSPGAGEVFPQGGSQAVKFITKVLGAMRKFLAVLLALPLGELSPQVTERAQQG